MDRTVTGEIGNTFFDFPQALTNYIIGHFFLLASMLDREATVLVGTLVTQKTTYQMLGLA